MKTLTPPAAQALARIEQAGGVRIDIPMVLPARTILELAGEGMRTRLCLFQDEEGRELCLRPEMTTPIAERVAKREIEPGRYVYAGEVFRLPAPGSSDAIEFPQLGFEWFGGGSVEEDVEAALLAMSAGASAAASTQAVFGDVALYRAVVDALDFAPVWKDRLKRSFARARGPLAVLEAGARTPDRERSSLAEALAGLDDAQATGVVDEIMALAGVQLAARRPAAEIVERLRERSSAQPPHPHASVLLGEYLALAGPAADAGERLKAFETSAGVKLGAARERFEDRLKRLASGGADLKSALFDPQLGRRFEYYDGFVFEQRLSDDPTRAVLSGGRYDGLIQRLKPASEPIAAIGASIRLDRLEATS